MEENDDKWNKSDHGFPDQERKVVDIWSNSKI
jgi:hypothetical protein